MKNENLIKVCAIVVIISMVFGTLMNLYFFFRNRVWNHDERKMICDTHENLVYIKSLQKNKEIVTCCELVEEHGVEHITYCEDILIK